MAYPSNCVTRLPAYMTPEQLAGRDASIQSDVYALGRVLYEVFTGKRAFEATAVAELRRAHENTPPTNPSPLVKDIDPIAERVILRCLPLTTQGSAWYAGIGLAGILLMAAMAFYGFYTSLGGRPVFGGAAFEE